MKADMISVEEAQKVILEHIGQLDVEQMGVVESIGRVLAQNLISDIDLAPFDNTAMDGFALRSADIADASEDSPVHLGIVFHLGAGYTYDKPVESGEAVRIMTGAPMPEGADTVVQLEHVTWTGEGTVGDELIVTKPAKPGLNIRFAGEEAKAGGTVLFEGDVMTPAAVGLAASAGHSTVTVYRRPRVGVISLGSELVDIDIKPAPGQIRNSNSYSLAADVLAAGGIPHIYPIAVDDEQVISSTVLTAISENDFVISSGGASGGDYDYIGSVAGELGTIFFTTVCMKPGKSQTFALLGQTPFLGLAGNPTAAEMGFDFLVRPALRKMQGYTELHRTVVTARLAAPLNSKRNPRRLYLRGRISRDGNGELVVISEKNQSSALLGPLFHSNCLIVVPENHGPVDEGELIECVRIDMPEGTVQ